MHHSNVTLVVASQTKEKSSVSLRSLHAVSKFDAQVCLFTSPSLQIHLRLFGAISILTRGLRLSLCFLSFSLSRSLLSSFLLFLLFLFTSHSLELLELLDLSWLPIWKLLFKFLIKIVCLVLLVKVIKIGIWLLLISCFDVLIRYFLDRLLWNFSFDFTTFKKLSATRRNSGLWVPFEIVVRVTVHLLVIDIN